MKRIHLDPVGGISGDMFLAAMLDAFPELEDGFKEVISAIGFEQKLNVTRIDHDNGVLTGSRVTVEELEEQQVHRHHPKHHHPHIHSHHHFRDIREMLQASNLKDSVKNRAIDIFAILADAEGRVHGVDPENVAFHEVGALDSIADITLAAYLIDAVGNVEWSTNPIPMGSGRIQSDHGTLPIPAPATLLLLNELPVFDDGIPGERITPTGAAILKHLQPKEGGPKSHMTLRRSGMGFGTKTFDDLPNVLRLIAFESKQTTDDDQIAALEFEIDDQTAEDLAIGLEVIRANPGVLDVVTFSVFGKKNRLAQSVRVLCKPDATEDVQTVCFQQTTTLGIRTQHINRTTLKRQFVQSSDGQVKIATRPNGITAKVEIDDVAQLGKTHQERARAGNEVSEAVLKRFLRGVPV